MLKLELVPDLNHCIETVAKKEYNDIVHKLLSTEDVNDELTNKAEILRLFLETADFKKLRAQSEPHLLKGEQVRFIVYLHDSIVKYEMHTQTQPHRKD
jgi:hypothetical protein